MSLALACAAACPGEDENSGLYIGRPEWTCSSGRALVYAAPDEEPQINLGRVGQWWTLDVTNPDFSSEHFAISRCGDKKVPLPGGPLWSLSETADTTTAIGCIDGSVQRVDFTPEEVTVSLIAQVEDLWGCRAVASDGESGLLILADGPSGDLWHIPSISTSNTVTQPLLENVGYFTNIGDSWYAGVGETSTSDDIYSFLRFDPFERTNETVYEFVQDVKFNSPRTAWVVVLATGEALLQSLDPASVDGVRTLSLGEIDYGTTFSWDDEGDYLLLGRPTTEDIFTVEAVDAATGEVSPPVCYADNCEWRECYPIHGWIAEPDGGFVLCGSDGEKVFLDPASGHVEPYVAPTRPDWLEDGESIYLDLGEERYIIIRMDHYANIIDAPDLYLRTVSYVDLRNDERLVIADNLLGASSLWPNSQWLVAPDLGLVAFVKRRCAPEQVVDGEAWEACLILRDDEQASGLWLAAFPEE